MQMKKKCVVPILGMNILIAYSKLLTLAVNKLCLHTLSRVVNKFKQQVCNKSDNAIKLVASL